MSIESLIQAHTEALVANTEAVKLLTLSLAGRTPKAEEKTPVGKAAKVDKQTKAEKAMETDANSQAQIVKREDIDAALADAKADTDAGVDYATVRALVLKLAPTNREAITAINKKHDIAKLPELLDDANDFNTVNDQAKLETVYADLQALDV